MAARELVGRSGQVNENAQIVRRWFSNQTSEPLAMAEVAAAAPSSIGSLVIKNVSCTEQVQDGYECEVTYGTYQQKAPPATGDSSFNFEIATAPARIVVPLQAQTIYPASGLTAPANAEKWLIGQQGDGSPPEGAEVFEPQASFSETHYIAIGTMTASHQRALLRIVGRINNATFKGWNTGEVLCTGVSGSKRGAEDWEVGFRFGVRENQTGLSIAGITGVAKNGWQYLWVRRKTEVDDDAKILTDVAEYVVIADVFRSADFSTLGIGT